MGIAQREKHTLALRRLDSRYALARTTIKGAFGAVCVWLITDTIRAFAGKETVALLSGILNVTVSEGIAYALSVVLGGGWVAERRLRRRTNREKAAHISELEKRLDPKRSSSGLTITGKPRKEDLDGA
jgi:hypothetical protein